MGTTRVTAPDGLPFIDISREFDAPRELLYRAYTEPDLLARWLGPRDSEMRIERYEVRDGGTWRYVSVGKDGAEYGFYGVFHGVPSPDLMVQTFEFEGVPGHVSLESLVLEDHDGRTLVKVHSVFQSVEDRDGMISSGMESGLDEGYDRLDGLLAGMLATAR